MLLSAKSRKADETLTVASAATLESLDPAWAYDTPSHGVILNIYETLVGFNPVYPRESAATGDLAPRLATMVPSPHNGLISDDGLTYKFPIRRGVRFHYGTVMSPEDVVYSLRRFLIMDRRGGPSALLLEPILGVTSIRDEGGHWHVTPADLERAIRCVNGTVVVTLRAPFGPFLAMLAARSYVVPKAWAASRGDWNGSLETMGGYHDPPKETTAFFSSANGTGPFRLSQWARTPSLSSPAAQEVVLERFEGYWRGPASLKRVRLRIIPDQVERTRLLQQSDVDSISVDQDGLAQLEDRPGIRILRRLPVMYVDPVIVFCLKVGATDNAFVGSGRLDGAGIPPDFFCDLHLRRAFLHAFDYERYLRETLRDMGTIANGIVPPGLLGYDSSSVTPRLDPERAVREFRLAWEGRVWSQGFRLTVAHNNHNKLREDAARLLKDVVESLNPRFCIETCSIPWSSYAARLHRCEFPIFLVGWKADYPDPHNFVFPFLHSHGTIAQAQGFKDEEFDYLVSSAVRETDAAIRKVAYQKIADRHARIVPSIPVAFPLGFRVLREHIVGNFYNPAWPGLYFYELSKNCPKT